MPLFKSKSKLTLEEKLIQSRLKSDEKRAKSREKFTEMAKNSEGKIPVDRVNFIFNDADRLLTDHRAKLDREAEEIRHKRTELAASTVISEKERRIREATLLKEETKIFKDEKASSESVRLQAQMAIQTDEIAMHDANQKEIRAHNKRVLGEWIEEVGEIGNDFLDEQRQISERNRSRRDDN